MTLSEDYAARIRKTADRIAGLGVDRHDPHRFHEAKDTLEKDLRSIASQVEIDQVFSRPSPVAAASAPAAFPTGPRRIVDRKGRSVPVVTRSRPASRRA